MLSSWRRRPSPASTTGSHRRLRLRRPVHRYRSTRGRSSWPPNENTYATLSGERRPSGRDDRQAAAETDAHQADRLIRRERRTRRPARPRRRSMASVIAGVISNRDSSGMSGVTTVTPLAASAAPANEPRFVDAQRRAARTSAALRDWCRRFRRRGRAIDPSGSRNHDVALVDGRACPDRRAVALFPADRRRGSTNDRP